MSSYKDSLDISMEDFSEEMGNLYRSDGEEPEVEEIKELEPLDIGSDLLDPSQLVGAMGQASQESVRADSSPSSSISSWAREVEEMGKLDLASLQHQGEQAGPGDQGLHHTSVEVPLEGASGDGVELVTLHPELQDRDWARIQLG